MKSTSLVFWSAVSGIVVAFGMSLYLTLTKAPEPLAPTGEVPIPIPATSQK